MQTCVIHLLPSLDAPLQLAKIRKPIVAALRLVYDRR